MKTLENQALALSLMLIVGSFHQLPKKDKEDFIKLFDELETIPTIDQEEVDAIYNALLEILEQAPMKLHRLI